MASVVGLGLLMGCTGGDTDTDAGAGESEASELTDAHARWEQAGVTDYSYLVHASCGERDPIGRWRVTVRDGTVAAADGLDEPSQLLIQRIGLDYVPTIDEMWDELLEAAESSAADARGDFDEVLGYPTSITIDWQLGAEDDEACYEITEFVGG